MALLDIDDIHVRYDRIEALKGVSLRVERGQIVALVGNNGAGKSTLMRTLSGLLRPHCGEIRLQGCALSRLAPHEIVGLGLRHVPEGRRIFSRLTVRENLDMGAFTRRDRSAVAEDRERMFGVFPVLKERRTQLAGTLSGGEQQMVAMARALMGRPQVLLLDEPGMGLSPTMVEQVFRIIHAISAQGVTILMVEQNALLALGIADVGHVLESGRIVLSGPGPSLLDDARVLSAYLG